MACILLREYRRLSRELSSLEGTATAISLAGGLLSIEATQKTLQNMDDYGARYVHWEQSLGLGAALVLGTELPESQ